MQKKKRQKRINSSKIVPNNTTSGSKEARTERFRAQVRKVNEPTLALFINGDDAHFITESAPVAWIFENLIDLGVYSVENLDVLEPLDRSGQLKLNLVKVRQEVNGDFKKDQKTTKTEKPK